MVRLPTDVKTDTVLVNAYLFSTLFGGTLSLNRQANAYKTIVLYATVNKLLLKNLALAGIVICILTGLTFAFIEFRQVDRHIADTAIRQSQKLTDQYIVFHNKRTSSSKRRLQQAIQSNLDHDLLISLELLDKNLVMVANEVMQNFLEPSVDLIKKFKQFEMEDTIEYQVVLYKGQAFIKVMVPIKASLHQNPIGPFQGIYHLPEDQMASIKQQSYSAIFLSLLVTIFTTLFIYSVFYRLYKKRVQRTHEAITANIDILKSLGSAVAQRDSDTFLDIYRFDQDEIIHI